MAKESEIAARELLRHTLATLAYRAGKAIREAPPTFGSFAVNAGSRTPAQILSHMCDLFDWALSMARGAQKWQNTKPQSWDADCDRFFRALEAFDDYLASDAPLGTPVEQLFQGPVADALTHTGQLTMLRRVAGTPIRGENYAKAEIARGRVGAEQATPKVEFD
ncbi:MAG TPA: hypothetical protein VGJ18_13365 [Gemmatimonadaceae bacterium]|jgi:hypothetical protein